MSAPVHMGRCAQSHYASVVESTKDVVIYQFGDDECLSCLRIMAKKHEKVAAFFHDRLVGLGGDS